jgi:hypothetical protein
VKALEERYAEPLPSLAAEVESLTERVPTIRRPPPLSLSRTYW